MFIKKVKAKGYKTIKDMEVDFNPGLNIIIGDNGSGKTNFLEVVTSTLEMNFKRFFHSFSSSIEFDNNIILDAENPTVSITEQSIGTEDSQVTYRLYNQKKRETTEIYKKSEMYLFLKKNGYKEFRYRFVKHGYPKYIELLNVPISGRKNFHGKDEWTNALIQLIEETENSSTGSYFSLLYKTSLVIGSIDGPNTFKSNFESITSRSLNYIKSYLKRCTPIDDIRLAESFSLTLTSDSISIQNLFFEFYQNGRWNNYNDLSDGTKRLLNIVLNVPDFIDVFKENLGFLSLLNEDFVIIIEEPELGINPHQLYKLMLLLKEEAQTKQIIITTHSPVALDVLERGEIDSIMLCEYDKIKETQIRRLTEREKAKAIGYMDEVGYLSLYWTHSNLQQSN